MNQSVLSRTDPDRFEHMQGHDILAMLSMLDWLITRISPIDEISATCLVMARQSLASLAPPPTRPQ
ncbi:MAG TPA: hypothetical protein VFU97_21525 [Xanthobacteraceae bacterium]|jgi:hypothetical protein|nr:hypothetical protein [Xanthobacteraceae bacterium]